ncbi:MAG TPA: nucleoside monophosphate kinase [Bryobacteraceae bacterium]|nr:nucleoside monophosphate kinase [Bryobacteraceae bacterium]
MLTAKHVSNRTRARVMILLGAPGSGKGTQGAWLSRRLGIPCLSTGEILRGEAKRNTPAGFRLRQLLATGALVDDETVCAVVGARLRREPPVRGVIFDGFPRTLQQAEFLDGLLSELGLPRPIAIHLDVSADGLLRRLSGRRQCAACGEVYNLSSRPSSRGSRCEKDGGALIQRDDDTEEVILRRLQEFESYSAPLIEYYEGVGYRRIAADREPKVVSEELLEIVEPAAFDPRSEVLLEGRAAFSGAA